MNISKYNFTSKEQANLKIDALNEEPNNHTIVTLGHIVLEPAVIDEDGVVITEAVLSTGWHLDVLWIGLTDHPYGWKSYNVDLTSEGVHGFAGLSYLSHKF